MFLISFLIFLKIENWKLKIITPNKPISDINNKRPIAVILNPKIFSAVKKSNIMRINVNKIAARHAQA